MNRQLTPLADRLRPERLSDVVGQQHLIGPGQPLSRMAESGSFKSCILHGPPGVGKTTIVRAACRDGGAHFVQLNATETKVDELRKTIKAAETAKNSGRQTIAFVDEIHRWSKSQQDVLLPSVESGTIVLFGATTDRPKHSVNSTIVSRVMVYELQPLSKQEMVELLKRVRTHYKSAGVQVSFDQKALGLLINRCSGDGRKLVTAMESIVELLGPEVTVESVEKTIPEKHLVFARNGDQHYDFAHAYQEAIQHSEADDAVYWLAQWLASGEDPAYVARRMLTTAFEDCGGNPLAPLLAMAAHYATERLGMPECMIPLSYATIEMAKSMRNKTPYIAVKLAMDDVVNSEVRRVPEGLRSGTNGYREQVAPRPYVQGWNRDCPTLLPVEQDLE